MRKLSTFVDCLLITAVAVAAPTANEDFVVAEDAKTYTNAVNAANAYTDGKIAEIPEPDFSTDNTELVETIESNPWGFLKLDDNNVLTVPTLTVGARAHGTIGKRSVAEGYEVTASGTTSHAEGDSTTAYGNSAHAEGLLSTAWGPNSHAEGYDTQTQNSGEHAQGRCNLSHTGATVADQTLSSIGIGGGNRDRKNAVETMMDGKTFIYGLGGYDGTNPTNGVKDLVAAIGGKLDNTGLHNNGGTLCAVSFDTDGLFIFNGTFWLDVPATSGPALTAGDLENPDAPLYQTLDEKASKGDIPGTVSNIVTAAYINDRVNVTPLAGRTYDFATNIGLYTAVRDVILALGGSVTNFPAIPQN